MAKFAIAASIEGNMVSGLPMVLRGAAPGGGASATSMGSTMTMLAALFGKFAPSPMTTRAEAECPMKMTCSEPVWAATARASPMWASCE